jgi:hypothetical protein
MKSQATKSMEQPHTLNLVTKLWQKLGCNALLLSKLSEYMKVAQIAVTAVLGSCEDERTFSTLSFVKKRSGTASRAISTLAFGCSVRAGRLSNPSLTTRPLISGWNRKIGDFVPITSSLVSITSTSLCFWIDFRKL